MTLIIVGHHRSTNFSTGARDGIFAAADGNITSFNEGTIFVDGFKKIFELPIRIKNLSFQDDYDGGYFHSYAGVLQEFKCLIAFAGSTLVAQHMINSITNHLGSLYPTYDHDNRSYKLAMLCQSNLFLENGCYYSNDMFSKSDLDNIINAEFVSEVVEHAINSTLKKTMKSSHTREVFHKHPISFILGFQCPKSEEYKIYKYTTVKGEYLDPESGDRLQELKIQKSFIPDGEFATIGLSDFDEEIFEKINKTLSEIKKSEQEGLSAYNISYEASEKDYIESTLTEIENKKISSTSESALAALSEIIDRQNQKIDKSANYIGKPCFLYILERNRLRLISRIDAD